MEDPIVVYIYGREGSPGLYQQELSDQLDRADIRKLGVELPKFSWRLRILKTLEIARQYPDETLIFVDAWDTLFLGTQAEVQTFPYDDAITFAAGKVAYPDPLYAEYALKTQNEFTTPWRYLNSNPMAGRGKLIADAIQWGLDKGYGLPDDNADTQDKAGNVCERFYTKLYLESPFKVRLDGKCELAQIFLCSTPGDIELVAVGSRRIRNPRTESAPLFLHMNGGRRIDTRLFAP